MQQSETVTTPAWRLALAWGFVGIPLAWGFVMTLRSALQLFA